MLQESSVNNYVKRDIKGIADCLTYIIGKYYLLDNILHGKVFITVLNIIT